MSGHPIFAWMTAWSLLAWAGPAAGQPQVEGLRIVTGSIGNCLACHALSGQPGIPSNFAPPLDGVGLRHDAATLRQWVVDARQIRPDTLMPPFGNTLGLHRPARQQAALTDEQIGQVVAALQALR
jgi:L-cysteine S-thiosulfotransferase